MSMSCVGENNESHLKIILEERSLARYKSKTSRNLKKDPRENLPLISLQLKTCAFNITSAFCIPKSHKKVHKDFHKYYFHLTSNQ